ncbi:MAG: succinate dehydrogenase flavoprotein subunit [Deltaproteobacteria bacterium]|nr:succinate dehydrogenase flavoprotein subunit [Deltaproteobacteria bacterium]
MAAPRILVVGGGMAGLMAAVRIAEQGHPVDLFSIVPVRRSHTVCAQGGINGAVNTRAEGDSPLKHFEETIVGGDFLANQPPVRAMCEAAPSLIYLFDRMGVMFNRTPEGFLDFRSAGGTKFARVVYAGGSTGQQMLYALDEQVRRYEVEGPVRKYEGWEFLSAVLDSNGSCRGITALDLRSMQVQGFPAAAVILATGGYGAIFGKGTISTICTGSAASAVYQQGAVIANGEFVQVHPTAIPGEDKYRLISETVRGDGGRLWTYRDGKPWYFLEEWYPAYGNLVPRDIATRAIYKVVHELGLGVNGQPMVYLDISHIDPERLKASLGSILEIYEKFMGEDPRKVPMRVFPAVHYTMGGLWVDSDQMTSLPGLFAVGECEFQYHGANRLGGNSLLSCLHGGMVAGRTVVEYVEGRRALPDVTREMEADRARQESLNEALFRGEGRENPYRLYDELGEWMRARVTVVRRNAELHATLDKVRGLRERARDLQLADRGRWTNPALPFARQLRNMLELALVVVQGALERNESRGAHYKPEFPERRDEEWLKTTRATYHPDGPKLSYEAVDTSLLTPRPRRYEMAEGKG